jgi:hypothetical protein
MVGAMETVGLGLEEGEDDGAWTRGTSKVAMSKVVNSPPWAMISPGRDGAVIV